MPEKASGPAIVYFSGRVTNATALVEELEGDAAARRLDHHRVGDHGLDAHRADGTGLENLRGQVRFFGRFSDTTRLPARRERLLELLDFGDADFGARTSRALEQRYAGGVGRDVAEVAVDLVLDLNSVDRLAHLVDEANLEERARILARRGRQRRKLRRKRVAPLGQALDLFALDGDGIARQLIAETTGQRSELGLGLGPEVAEAVEGFTAAERVQLVKRIPATRGEAALDGARQSERDPQDRRVTPHDPGAQLDRDLDAKRSLLRVARGASKRCTRNR